MCHWEIEPNIYIFLTIKIKKYYSKGIRDPGNERNSTRDEISMRSYMSVDSLKQRFFVEFRLRLRQLTTATGKCFRRLKRNYEAMQLIIGYFENVFFCTNDFITRSKVNE